MAAQVLARFPTTALRFRSALSTEAQLSRTIKASQVALGSLSFLSRQPETWREGQARMQEFNTGWITAEHHRLYNVE